MVTKKILVNSINRLIYFISLHLFSEPTSVVNIEPEVGQRAVPEVAPPTAPDAAQHADPETEHLLNQESNC